MGGIGLGLSAVTLASHVVLILSAFILYDVYARLRHTKMTSDGIAISDPANLAIKLVITAFVLERGYYISARMLAPLGFNLWQLHPAPEMLSGLLAAFCFAAAVTLGRTSGIAFLNRRTVLLSTLTLLAIWWAVLWWTF